ncbi:MAG: KpsF/GutQ family sugar-phosphate isomerase [Oligoflexia bacterium]|nr:KpsF/GutQ family sugar-phosphate isomerase [Oligoflexia bacterium]MBF0365943.1 KpsF/GutQ family sugar-phosphate isomerase [Oligoflexia bacterium]
MNKTPDYLPEYELLRQTLLLEAKAIERTAQLLSKESIAQMVNLFNLLIHTGGNLVFSGVGKSGLIGQKLASTFSSLGLPSYFLHPTEALHGDLGRVSKSDALVIISKSGTTEEIQKLLPFLPIPHEMIIGMIGEIPSPLASKASILFNCSVEREACLNNQAPTTSTLVTLSIGDALTVLYEQVAGISKEAFASNHPGGILGKSLRLHVRDLMIASQDVPTIAADTSRPFKDAILLMTENPLGICAIVSHADTHLKLLGIIVDGDIRRVLSARSLHENSNHSGDALDTPISKIMNTTPITIKASELAYKALELMEKRERQISVLPVVDDEDHFLGIIRLHDLLREGFLLKQKATTNNKNAPILTMANPYC